MLSDQFMMRFEHRKRLYLHTDFSAISFGYADIQPGDNKDSLAAMKRGMVCWKKVRGLCMWIAPVRIPTEKKQIIWPAVGAAQGRRSDLQKLEEVIASSDRCQAIH